MIVALIVCPSTFSRTDVLFRPLQALEPDGAAHGSALESLPGVTTGMKMGDKWRLYTENPSALLPSIIDYATARNLRVVSLNTLAPSLEDVFLQITGGQVGTVKHDPDDKPHTRKHGGHS